MTEIWTAISKEESDKNNDPYIIFEVRNTNTNNMREERRYKSALPLMMTLGGYPPIMAAVMLMKAFPWSFHKVGDHIYIQAPRAE